MTGLVVSNQRGGVGKTTTAINLAGYLAHEGKRVLLIDTDSQGSVGAYLGLYPEKCLADLFVAKAPLSACITRHSENLDVICSNRETSQAEAVLLGQTAREMALKLILRPAEINYDYVIIDVAPSITLLQTCAMVFARNVLVPLDMDMLSLQGAQMAIEAARMLNDIYGIEIKIVGFLPTQVNLRHSITGVVRSALEMVAHKTGIPILPDIRQDQTVHKAHRQKQFLFEFDGNCNAAQDYQQAFQMLIEAFEGPHVQPRKAQIA